MPSTLEDLRRSTGGEVWKFPVNPGHTGIEMPADARVLCVQTQHGQPFIWALVRPDQPKKLRHFLLVGTGYQFDLRDVNYVGTFQLDDGNLVFHLFEYVRHV
jgi:hypothetical protein